MVYLDSVRQRLLELFDPRLPEDKIREKVAALLEQEVRKSYWNGVQYAHQ